MGIQTFSVWLVLLLSLCAFDSIEATPFNASAIYLQELNDDEPEDPNAGGPVKIKSLLNFDEEFIWENLLAVEWKYRGEDTVKMRLKWDILPAGLQKNFFIKGRTHNMMMLPGETTFDAETIPEITDSLIYACCEGLTGEKTADWTEYPYLPEGLYRVRIQIFSADEDYYQHQILAETSYEFRMPEGHEKEGSLSPELLAGTKFKEFTKKKEAEEASEEAAEKVTEMASEKEEMLEEVVSKVDEKASEVSEMMEEEKGDVEEMVEEKAVEMVDMETAEEEMTAETMEVQEVMEEKVTEVVEEVAKTEEVEEMSAEEQLRKMLEEERKRRVEEEEKESMETVEAVEKETAKMESPESADSPETMESAETMAETVESAETMETPDSPETMESPETPEVEEMTMETMVTPEAKSDQPMRVSEFSSTDCKPILTGSPTGRTSGHVANLTVKNNCDQEMILELGPYIIPSEFDRQGYVIPEPVILMIPPHRTKTVALDGWCLNVELDAASGGGTLPSVKNWTSREEFADWQSNWSQTGQLEDDSFKKSKSNGRTKTIRIPGHSRDFEFQTNKNADAEATAYMFVEAANALAAKYDELEEKEERTILTGVKIYSRRETFIQQAMWQYANLVSGEGYPYSAFEKVVMDQEITRHWKGVNSKKDFKILEEETRRLWDRIQLFGQQAGLWKVAEKGSMALAEESRSGGVGSGVHSNTIAIWDKIHLTGPESKIIHEKKSKLPIIAGAAIVALAAGTAYLLRPTKDCNDNNYNIFFDAPSSLCEGSTAQLSFTNDCEDCTSSWTDGISGASREISEIGIYTARITDGDDCVFESSINIMASEPFQVEITGDAVVCPGAPTTLSVIPLCNGCTYQWSTGGDDRLEVISDPGPVTVTVTNAGGCTSNASFLIGDGSGIDISIAGPSSICSGEPAILQVVSECPDCTYEWSNGETGLSIVVSDPGAYWVQATTQAGCSTVVPWDVGVDDLPDATISGALEICEGFSTTLAVPACDDCTYVWSNGSVENQIDVGETGQYTVNITNGTGCQSGSAAIVNFVGQSLTISGDDDICSGQMTTLTADTDCADCEYIWSNGSTESSIEVDEIGIYECTISNAMGCFTSASFEVFASPPLNLEILGTPFICPGSMATLGSNLQCEDCIYTWSTGSDEPTVSVTEPGTVTLNIETPDGCTGFAEVNVQEAASPDVDIDGATEVCEGGSATLNAVVTDCDECIYVWSTGETGESISVSSAGLYAVAVTNAAGCQAIADVNIESTTSLEVSIGGTVSFCADCDATLEAFPNNDDYTYTWNNGMSGQSISIDQPGSYSVIVSTADGCEGEAEIFVSGDEEDIVFDIIGDTNICPGTEISLSTNLTCDVNEFSWSNGSTNTFITIDEPGVYTVEVSTPSGCTGTASIEVTVDEAQANDDFFEAPAGEVFDFNVLINDLGAEAILSDIEIISGEGDIVFSSADGLVTYISDASYEGIVLMEYSIESCGQTDEAEVLISVLAGEGKPLPPFELSSLNTFVPSGQSPAITGRNPWADEDQEIQEGTLLLGAASGIALVQQRGNQEFFVNITLAQGWLISESQSVSEDFAFENGGIFGNELQQFRVNQSSLELGARTQLAQELGILLGSSVEYRSIDLPFEQNAQQVWWSAELTKRWEQSDKRRNIELILRYRGMLASQQKALELGLRLR